MAELYLNISVLGSWNLLSDSGAGLASVDARLAASLPLIYVLFSYFDTLRFEEQPTKLCQVDFVANFGFLERNWPMIVSLGL